MNLEQLDLIAGSDHGREFIAYVISEAREGQGEGYQLKDIISVIQQDVEVVLDGWNENPTDWEPLP